MRLHILGPAFGLPSIDAECIAATALLQLSPLDGWEVVAARDFSRPLPRLTDDNEAFTGFDSIASRVASLRGNQSISTDNVHKADSAAIASFLRAHGQPLLDISLYVSSENYSTTRSAFTKILPWYTNYFYPPKRRADARNRTQHLGISSIDVEDVHEDLSNRPAGFDVGKEPQFEADASKRASLLLPRKSRVRSLLQRPEHSAVFKLHALADNLFGPLQDMLGQDQYFLGTYEPMAVDCLVYGYLSLMLYPVLPQDWLAKTMRRKYGKLLLFTQRMHEKLGMQTDVGEAMSLNNRQRRGKPKTLPNEQLPSLPWAAPPATSISNAAKTVALELAALIPIMRPFEVVLVQANPPPPKHWSIRYLPAAVATAATSVGLLTYFAFSTGYLVWPHGEAVHIFGRKRFADYGHLGAALAGVSLLRQQAASNVTIHPQDTRDRPTRVEVEVEKDVVR